MSLMRCPECTHQVSDLAASCPACGYPMKEQPQRRRSRRSNNLIISIITICLGTVGAVCSLAANQPIFAGIGIAAAIMGTVSLVRVLVVHGRT